MALIKCPECSKEISDKAESCPNCSFPITKHKPPSFPPMLWDSEEDGYICVTCPKCNKIGRIKESSTFKIATGYKLRGEGKCSCGLIFNEVFRDERIKCPKCFSTDLSIQKEGFKADSACCGALLFGPLGILCGAKDSNKLNHHCLNCGYKWRVG